MIADLKLAGETMGMTTEEAKLYELAQRNVAEASGAVSEAAFSEARALIEKNKALEEQQKLAKDITELEDALYLQVVTFGMTSDEVDIYKLQMRGATEEQLAFARAAQNTLQTLDQQKDMMKKGADLMKQYRSPEQEVLDTQKELHDLLSMGAIDRETYDKALDDSLTKAEEAINPNSKKKDRQFREYKPDISGESKQLLEMQALLPNASGTTP